VEIFPLTPSEGVLFRLIDDIFTNYWKLIRFGVLIQGAVWEIKAPCAPKKISLLDGYITVDFGSWHFHLCVGQTMGPKSSPTTLELAKHRRTSQAEFYRQLDRGGNPSSWGFRMFNGKGEQQATIFFPSPFFSKNMKPLKKPDWAHLATWEILLKTHLGIESDVKERKGVRLPCH